jgi:hypothetical protein
MSCNSVFLESLLKNLVIVDKFELMLCIEVNFADSDSSWIDSIDDLTVNATRSALLNFGELEVKKRVRPVQNLGPSYEKCSLHHSY